MFRFAFFLSVLFSTASPAWALTVLKGQEAARHLGDAKTHFTENPYTYEILSRSHRDSMHGRFSDGVIFNRGGGLFSYPKRKDGAHRVVLDSPDGREEDPVTADAWRQKIENTLSDDNRDPYVFLDDQGSEIGVLYVGRGTKVQSKINSSNLLEIDLTVEGSQALSGRRRRIS